MQPHLASEVATPAQSPSSLREFVWKTLLFFTLGALWLVLCRHLSAEWTYNEQYSYGWFVPFFALYLFWLRWDALKSGNAETRKRENGVHITLKSGRAENRKHGNFSTSQPRSTTKRFIAAATAILALLLLLPIRVFEIGNPDWRPLGWIHAAVVAALTLIYIWSVGGVPWVRHFAFPIAFFFVAIPWVTPIEVPIIQGLMRIIAGMAAETANLFGIPARLQGNLIQLPNGLVGVNEACSGVRSLQTSLMIGLLFGELKRLSILRRLVLVLGAIAIAFIANFSRAVFLVWIAATKEISAVDRWHDIAGYTIVALVFLGSLALAAMLAKQRSDVGCRQSDDETHNFSTTHLSSTTQPSYPFLISILVWLLAVEIGAEFWYRSNERNLVATTAWTIQWPERASNFHQMKIDQEVRRTLRFDEGQAASWHWPDNSSDASDALPHKRITCSLFFFHWKPGRNSALLANLHRPDVCLPAVGWQQIADTGVKNYPVAPALTLPFRHFEFRHGTEKEPAQQVAHAFYCLWEDRAPASRLPASQLPQMTTSPSAWTREERLRAVLEGRRHLGQQVMEFVIQSRGPINFDQADARFAQALPKLIEIRDQKSDDGSRKQDGRSTNQTN